MSSVPPAGPPPGPPPGPLHDPLVGQVIGKHLIADFYGALYQTDLKNIEKALGAAANAAGAVVLNVVVHRFPNSSGVTGVAILAESHISIHTWPEHDYIALDIFMCGNSDPQVALDWLRDFFEPKEVKIQLIERAATPATQEVKKN